MATTDLDPADDVIAALTRVELADALLRTRLRGRLGINGTDLAALQYIDRCEAGHRTAYAKDLIPLLGVTSAATTTIVDRLTNAGHVFRSPDPANRRTRPLRLTDSTRQLLDATVGSTQTRLRGLVAAMSRRDRERAVRLMDDIRDALEAGAPDDDHDDAGAEAPTRAPAHRATGAEVPVGAVADADAGA